MKSYGETQCLEVAESFDDEGILLFEIEGIPAWVSWEEVRDLRDHLNKALER